MNDLKIFIVEDDAFYSGLLKGCLKGIGYTDIETFPSGEACELNLYKNPDVILLDHNLTDKKGIDVLKAIKGFNPEIYVIYISGQKDLQITIDSLKFGAFDYIIKDPKVNERLKSVFGKIEKLIDEHRNRTGLKGLKSFINNLNIF